MSERRKWTSKRRCKWPSSLRCDFIVTLPKMQGHPAMCFKDYDTDYFCSNEFQGRIKLSYFSKQIIDTKKTIEEKGKDLVKMRIQGQQFFSFLFVPIADFCLFVANQKLVESNPSMNVSKTRKKEF